ncbi:MAG TPA: hypothetical protein VET65_14460, partial [Candidatus Limnocylindrales bacterium]|nr:hypothetical protein [Candidatus Limnocylindrales bacterium]
SVICAAATAAMAVRTRRNGGSLMVLMTAGPPGSSPATRIVTGQTGDGRTLSIVIRWLDNLHMARFTSGPPA